MLVEIKKKWRRALIFPKIVWTLIIIFIYMAGRMLPITTLSSNQETLKQVANIDLINNLASVTGANFSSITVFTLGLSPWMTAMIIWRFFTVFGIFKQITSVQLHRYRMLLTIVIGGIQAFGLTNNAQFSLFQDLGATGLVWARAITIFLLITGSFVLTWLGSVNSRKGLGGMTVIILVNMILSFVENISKYLANGLTGTIGLNVLFFALCWFILVVVTVIFYRAEYRISIRRVGVNNAYNKGSYLPIRITPAGAMPFMYGMTMMLLPPYVISGLLIIFPDSPTLLFLATNIGISKLPGVLFYIVLLYVLAIGFSYYNYDSYDIAKNMRNNGDYIEKIRPGEQTRKYIQRKINILAQFGACFVVLIGGMPLLVIVLQSGTAENVNLTLLISNVFIISSLLLGVIEQVNMLQNWKKYKNLI
ncbi:MULTISPECIES: accessory Sec system protein translocase subunit SecY2 [unclassified Streptococcus]|uniref:accessory Sec system protein translocase subunit SecY2 n=1 Tax=unclassified Streptococcus TaxID=2608887 RepID=UPI00107246CA|nr:MULTISPECIES: accessory Sec system protein translocase subunit SecY2 [unclassified Streptococcus]MBF0787144.1 accessory Sec system protein translocase subunit SecY2 [Streptococcus sp. 19428wC2_LYSM12]MCQ9212139.1 accessory Sec system protein translocase subunit SecY2 [Streptococcus sp. B01]MCQ9213468.1 accessory Sec system protein translocase subunit SecY2 [Streptococcus sp. O1]TFV05901.1 accessory Sec system protein translocase subunit SecY2 [Streptococcus sp. LYSM12]